MKYNLLILCTLFISSIYATLFSTSIFLMLTFIADQELKLVIFRALFILAWVITFIIAISLPDTFIIKWLKQRKYFK